MEFAETVVRAPRTSEGRTRFAPSKLVIAGFAFAAGFGATSVPALYAHFYTPAGAPIYTLYMGRSDGHGGHDEVRRHVATFDLAETSRDANRDACEHIRAILQNRTTTGLAFWCEAGRFRR